MRERINVPLSDYFQNSILLPEAIRDYRVNFQEFILLNKAYALMLFKINILDKNECRIILQGLDNVCKNLKEDDISGNCEDLYFNIDQSLIREIGIKIGGKLHTGRSRNDIYSALTRMEVRKSIWVIIDKLIELQDVLLQKAEENIDTIITGYTHMQPAQPITLAHYYTAIVYTLTRDFSRIKSAYENTNNSPYGAAAFAGSTYNIDRQYLANITGFDNVMINSLDCIASKDFMVQTEMAFTVMMLNISRLAEDLYFWATDECGILDVGGEVAICSSIMPQKKNPVCFEYAKAKAAHTIGTMISVTTVLKNVPFSNNEDIFEASTLFQDCFEQTLQGIGIIAEAIRYSKIRKDVALSRAKNNYSTVTSLADYIVKNEDISFEEAHQIVGAMVGENIDKGLPLEKMNSFLLKQASKKIIGKEIVMDDTTILKVLDPIYNITQKISEGSPNPLFVKKMINDLHVCIKEEKNWIEAAKKNVQDSYKRLFIKQAQVIN